MAADYTGDVGHTTITDLRLVSVEYLAQFRLLWEVFTNQLKETAADVGCDALAKRRIEPDYTSLALTFPYIRR